MYRYMYMNMGIYMCVYMYFVTFVQTHMCMYVHVGLQCTGCFSATRSVASFRLSSGADMLKLQLMHTRHTRAYTHIMGCKMIEWACPQWDIITIIISQSKPASYM